MILETAATTAIVSAAKPLVKPFVEKYVTSKLQSFAEWCKKKHKEVMIPTAEHFQEYLERSYDKYSIVNTLVFHNSQRQLKDIYVAQTLIKENRIGDDEEKTKIEGLPAELIKKYQKILITDTAGMGKSTILKRMFVDLIDKGLDIVGIPMYIELNKLNKTHTILKEIQEELNSLSEEFDKELLLKLIQTGGFIFFLDGYDEISLTDRIEVNSDIKSFISKAGMSNYYVLTSRPEVGLSSFGDFQSFKIQALTKDEAYELLDKYDITNKKTISNKLINLLKSGEYNSIDEYLENPLLVSLLYSAFDYKQIVPLKKHLFYRQVFEAYFDSHDLSKGISAHSKRSGLDIDDFSRVLKCIGYICLKKTGVKFDEDTILKVIRNAKSFCVNLCFKESDFLKDLLLSVPLFCRDGNEYKWVHKSLMEYFAARFLSEDVSEKQDYYLSDIYHDEAISKYGNMLDLFYDIDYKGFSKGIMLPFLEEYVKYHDKYFPNECILDADLIEERIAAFYPYYDVVVIRREFFYNTDGQTPSQTINNYIISQFKVHRKEGWSSIPGYYDGFVLMGCSNSSFYSTLSHILCNKKPQLFTEFTDYRFIPKIIDKELFKENKVYPIHVLTGIENEDLFLLINCLLIDSHHERFLFDYAAVINEIKNLKNEIERSNNTMDLLVGL